MVPKNASPFMIFRVINDDGIQSIIKVSDSDA